MTNNRENIIKRINKVLYEMENDGIPLDEHYHNLKAKRDAIVKGEQYCTYNIAPYLITYVACHVPDVNMGMNNKTLKGRGNKEKTVIEVITGIK